MGLLDLIFGSRSSGGSATSQGPRGTGARQTPVANRPANRRSCRRFGADRVALIGFGEDARMIALPAEPFAPWLQERIEKLSGWANGTGTNLTAAIRLALQVHEKTPPNALRRVWVFTDGLPNRQVDQLVAVVDQAAQAGIPINTVAFGAGEYVDAGLLQRISAATHGKFITIDGLRALTDALLSTDVPTRPGQRRHRSETTVVLVDLSASMQQPMEGRTKIEVAREGLLHFLNWKQKVFS